LCCPLAGRDDFGRANPSVLVRIDEIERLCVELDAARRTRQRHPEFLVELIEMSDVLAPLQFDLIEAARAKE
jgi:hypothetical protein